MTIRVLVITAAIVLLSPTSFSAQTTPLHGAETVVESPLTDTEMAEINSMLSSLPRRSEIGSLDEILSIRRPAMRKEVLNRAVTWNQLKISNFEILIFILTCGWFIGALIYGTRYKQVVDTSTPASTTASSSSTVKKKYIPTLKELLFRDLGPMSYDSSLHREKASRSEYRGFIHWIRDVIEKALSIALMLGFAFFLARGCSYFKYWLFGEGWKLVYLPIDINIALTFVGLALILDAFILVSTMTDAPGISRTLDTVIVVLAGFVVMLVEAKPGDYALVAFRFGNYPWLGSLIASTIGFLFIIRWVVRNHNVAELLRGKDDVGSDEEPP